MMNNNDELDGAEAATTTSDFQQPEAKGQCAATAKSWTIHDFDIGRSLGRGKFGTTNASQPLDGVNPDGTRRTSARATSSNGCVVASMPSWYELMANAQFLRKDPASRITLQEALRHPWLVRNCQVNVPKPTSRSSALRGATASRPSSGSTGSRRTT
ncbi:hypothetical protein DYB32_008473 [Aphanomyces invadans]|uniref:Aurora kinase n=1 Tax=Aphanomyces invadans TaxID=157072 RepID=A0A3R6V5R5_9STRA|nr:hypothetical protein DYB32_008473 [Aphanomyces invadans]